MSLGYGLWLWLLGQDQCKWVGVSHVELRSRHIMVKGVWVMVRLGLLGQDLCKWVEVMGAKLSSRHIMVNRGFGLC